MTLAPEPIRSKPSFPIQASAIRATFSLMRVSGLLALAVLLAACGAAGSSERLGSQPVDADVMHELLTPDDIQDAGGDASRLRMEVEDVLATADMINPRERETLRSWHAMKVKQGNNNAVLIFTVVEFNSRDEARERLALIESGLGFEPMDPPIGDGSSMLATSSSTGLSFAKGFRVITIQTTIGDLAEPILDEAGVEQLARIVENRL